MALHSPKMDFLKPMVTLTTLPKCLSHGTAEITQGSRGQSQAE